MIVVEVRVVRERMEVPAGTRDKLMQERYRFLQIAKAEVFEYASALTVYLAQQYGIPLQIQQCRGRGSYYRWRNGHVIYYSPNGLHQVRHYGYEEYKTVRYCWNDITLRVYAFEGIHHVVLHEFAHVLDAEYGPRFAHTNAPACPRSNGRRILHGIVYQRWLQELIILVPFDEVTPQIIM